MSNIQDRADTDGLKEAVIDALYVVWCRCPQLRLGQLLANALIRGDDERPLFYVEDFDLLRKAEAFVRSQHPSDGEKR